MVLFGNTPKTTSRMMIATHAVEAAVVHDPRHIMAFPPES